MVLILGIIVVIIFRVFYAGKHSIFFVEKERYSAATGKNVRSLEFDAEAVLPYVLFTAVYAIFWPVVMPCLGIYYLGRKYSK